MSCWSLVLLRGWTNSAVFQPQTCRCRFCAASFLFGSTFFNFLALNTLQLAETMSIFFFSPMLITALAGPLLGEWAGWRRWMAILAGFAGVLVITRPGFGSFEHRPCLRALRDHQLQPLRHHDAAHGGDGNAGKPDLLFGAGAGRADAAGRAATRRRCRPTPSTGLVLLSLGFFGGVRPLVADQGLPAGDNDGAGALSLSADGLDDRCSAIWSSTNCRISGRSSGPRSSSPAGSISSTASTGCGWRAAQRRTAEDEELAKKL